MLEVNDKELLTKALLNYLRCLQITPEADEQVFLRRLVDIDTDKTKTNNTLTITQLKEKLQQLLSQQS